MKSCLAAILYYLGFEIILMENYSSTLQLNATVDKTFTALTEEIPLWWTATFNGAAHQGGHVFTVHFGKDVYKTMRIEYISRPTKIVWKVIDSLIAIPGLDNQTEWIGTAIVWELAPREKNTELQLTHIGLHPGVECYGLCTKGWQQFTDSLTLFVETGKGRPFKA
jgi:hypothetical protein